MAEGSLRTIDLKSEVLKGNPLGDPFLRRLYIYLPPGFGADPVQRYPALLALAGFTGNGAAFFSPSPFSQDLKDRLDGLITSGRCAPCLVVAPDCFTRLGGSQYLNSSATGRYQDYLLQEIIPFIQREFQPSRWGVFGKSSGGFGAMILAMEHPEVFQAVANHSGDSNFELAYLPHFGKALDKFRMAGGMRQWLERFWDEAHPENRKDIDTLEKLAMAACYSPNPESKDMGIDFPFDLETGVFRQEVWRRWRAWDPVHRVPVYLDNLKRLKAIYVDCGSKDEFALHWGCRALVARMREGGVKVHYDEFNDGHRSVSYRLDVSLPFLCRALARD